MLIRVLAFEVYNSSLGLRVRFLNWVLEFKVSTLTLGIRINGFRRIEHVGVLSATV